MAAFDDTDTGEHTATIPADRHVRIGVRKVDGSAVQIQEIDTRGGGTQECIFVRRPVRADAIALATTMVAASPGSLGWALIAGERVEAQVIPEPEDRPTSVAEAIADYMLACADPLAAFTRLLRLAKKHYPNALRSAAQAAGIVLADIT